MEDNCEILKQVIDILKRIEHNLDFISQDLGCIACSKRPDFSCDARRFDRDCEYFVEPK